MAEEFGWKAMPNPTERTRYFISYRSTAAFLAERLETDLLARGHEVWRDKRSLPVGEAWRASIKQGIEWCQTLLLILSEGAEESKEVRAEVELASQIGCRVEAYSIGPVDRLNKENASENARAIYELLKNLHIAQLPVDGETERLLSSAVLSDEDARHPMDPAVFRRVFARRAMTAEELMGLDTSILQAYASNRTEPLRDGPCLCLNLSLILSQLGKSKEALTLLREAETLESPIIDLYRSALLCEGKRPGVLATGRRSEAIAASQRAFQATRSPLTGLHLCLMLWDVGLKRGPNAANMIASAIENLKHSPNDRAELARYLQIFPVEKLQGPFDGCEFKILLGQIGAL